MANASFLNHINGMDSESFRASRWTSGNHLFPTVIMVTDRAVVRHKRSWFSKDEISFNLSKIASVHIKTGMIWSDILIESSGGTDAMGGHGHRRVGGLRIKELSQEGRGALRRYRLCAPAIMPRAAGRGAWKEELSQLPTPRK